MNPTVRKVEGRDVSAAEAAQIVTLLRRTFGDAAFWAHGTEAPTDCVWWKMRDAPWGSSAIIMEIESRIVGFVLHLHRRVLLNGVERVARDGCDLAIDPEFQGRGLYRVMHRAGDERFEDSFDFVFTYETHGASKHLAPERNSRKFGNALRLYWRPIDVARLTGRPFYSRGGGIRWHARLGLAALRRAVRPGRRRRWSISRIARFDDRLDAFCDVATRPFALVHKRTAASLNWRFCDPRSGRFTAWLAEQDGAVVGYIVLSVKRQTGYIADLLALPGRLDVVDSLVGHAVRVLKTSEATTLRCRIPTVHPYTPVLRRHGLIPDPAWSAGDTYRARRLDINALAPLEDPNLPSHVMLGDSDHI